MFVRWKKNGKHSFAAVLVESCRIDGKPRQKIIKHLATIYEGNPKDAHTGETSPDQFWYYALNALDEIEERITPIERERIEKTLRERVPQPEDGMVGFPMRARAGRPRA